MKVSGTVALVTGAAKGIGRAFCTALLEKGAAVVEMLDICSTEGEELQKEFESRFGAGKARFTHCDVTCKESLTKAIHGAVSAHGQLNILCNNAGILDENNWEEMLAVNLVSVIRGTQIGLEVMAEGGLIVNTASITGLQAIPMAPVYATTKHGVVGYTRSIAPVAFKKKRVRVNCICPGTVLTSRVEAAIHDPANKPFIEKYGILSPETVAHSLLQLIEDDSKNGAVMKITQTKGIDFMKYPDP